MAALLDVDRLTVEFTGLGSPVKAVRDVSFSLGAGERVGVVGESGSGKSVTSQAVMRLLPDTARIGGSIEFDGRDVLSMDPTSLAVWRGSDIAMVFQDPMSSLNPLMRVGTQIMEVLRRHRGLSKSEARAESVRLLRVVGIADAERRVRDYPHQFSGGMRQRVCIAIAAACTPKLIIADEPTTALDVTIQAQVLDLLDHLSDEHGTAVMLISHDLGVVSSFCDRILIMYAGRIVEAGSTEQIIMSPRHPYTRALLDSIPRLRGELPRRLPTIPGAPPTGATPHERCSFAARCPRAEERCGVESPDLVRAPDGRETACHFPLDAEVALA
ncbi:ABC transporter ATP-binding protein [Mumia sp. Pv 4-285]|uniref:ABC transporter ATP-binding protein n=1 Tax=Mumia qirimensis TaxID=3234852 RepID=UPI00351DA80B